MKKIILIIIVIPLLLLGGTTLYFMSDEALYHRVARSNHLHKNIVLGEKTTGYYARIYGFDYKLSINDWIVREQKEQFEFPSANQISGSANNFIRNGENRILFEFKKRPLAEYDAQVPSFIEQYPYLKEGYLSRTETERENFDKDFFVVTQVTLDDSNDDNAKFLANLYVHINDEGKPQVSIWNIQYYELSPPDDDDINLPLKEEYRWLEDALTVTELEDGTIRAEIIVEIDDYKATPWESATPYNDAIHHSALEKAYQRLHHGLSKRHQRFGLWRMVRIYDHYLTDMMQYTVFNRPVIYQYIDPAYYFANADLQPLPDFGDYEADTLYDGVLVRLVKKNSSSIQTPIIYRNAEEEDNYLLSYFSIIDGKAVVTRP